MKINFVTTNKMKFEIAEAYFKKLKGDYELVQYEVETPEIQDLSTIEIAKQSALWIAKETRQACIKMDVGFFINALNGFPGPFVKYVNDWLSQDDVLNLLKDKHDRSAYFEDTMAVAFPDGRSEVFSLKYYGQLATEIDTTSGKWPMNLLFIPEGHKKPLGSLSQAAQNKFWGDGNWPSVIKFLESTQ